MKYNYLYFALLLVNSQVVGYSRKDYGLWSDDDGDCQNTRHEMLISQSLQEVKFDQSGCHVIKGNWLDAYTNQSYVFSKDLEVDHVVALQNADINGANQWNLGKKNAFANDEMNLLLVSQRINRVKGSKNPSQWLPPNIAFRCSYVRVWWAIKQKWGLGMSVHEAHTMILFQNNCNFTDRRKK